MSGKQSNSVAIPAGTSAPEHGSVPSGTHTMLELYGCSAELLNDPQFIERAIRDATTEGRCELIQINHHRPGKRLVVYRPGAGWRRQGKGSSC